MPSPVWLEVPDVPALPLDVLPNIGIFDSNNSKKELLNLTQVTTLCVDRVLSSNNCDNESVSLALWLDVSMDEMSVPTLVKGRLHSFCRLVYFRLDLEISVLRRIELSFMTDGNVRSIC